MAPGGRLGIDWVAHFDVAGVTGQRGPGDAEGPGNLSEGITSL
jgi:hypothetical protein